MLLCDGLDLSSAVEQLSLKHKEQTAEDEEDFAEHAKEIDIGQIPRCVPGPETKTASYRRRVRTSLGQKSKGANLPQSWRPTLQSQFSQGESMNELILKVSPI